MMHKIYAIEQYMFLNIHRESNLFILLGQGNKEKSATLEGNKVGRKPITE